ncbi:Sensor histidine kinase YehU [termite gut metagenome]|uniref:Sensor histidine kinase YehU n=1 Tax=termite gut metagenome TaxID=433724 RepID=A0A5J4RR88_9ZZZZ
MKLFHNQVSNKKVIFVSFIVGAFIIYPRIIDLPWELSRISDQSGRVEHILFFVYRYLFFCLLSWMLLSFNIRKQTTLVFTTRLLQTFLITVVAYIMYVLISLVTSKHVDCFTGLLLFQFVVACLLCTLTGHAFALYAKQHKQELEIEKLHNENLKSRYEALTNQINPHFFFNSLNGLSALVRADKKTQTLRFIHELSGVFRYILQSDKKGIVHLSDELRFLDSFRYLQEIRYAENFRFDIRIPAEKRTMLIPVLSLLPLIENIVKHNVIDSENLMNVSVYMNDRDELVISNPIHTKLTQTDREGIGIKNLSARFELLLNKTIRTEMREGFFFVYLQL